ncbi:MAG: hypothetical protein WD178_03555, partial [Actinomycetota bacterium]
LAAIPAWTGHSMFNIKDVPSAVGYTLVTAGLVVALSPAAHGPSRRTRRWLVGPAIAVGVFIGVGTLPVFGLQLAGRWWLAIPVLLLGIIAFFAVGLVIGAFCKTEEATPAWPTRSSSPWRSSPGYFFPSTALRAGCRRSPTSCRLST